MTYDLPCEVLVEEIPIPSYLDLFRQKAGSEIGVVSLSPVTITAQPPSVERWGMMPAALPRLLGRDELLWSAKVLTVARRIFLFHFVQLIVASPEIGRLSLDSLRPVRSRAIAPPRDYPSASFCAPRRDPPRTRGFPAGHPRCCCPRRKSTGGCCTFPSP